MGRKSMIPDISVLGPGPGGAAYLYHSSPSSGEHFFVGRVRESSGRRFLYCHLCDAVTSIPRSDTNEDHRNLQAFIDAGSLASVALADGASIDPLVCGKEDADAGVTTPTASRKTITTPVPQDTAGRKATIAGLRAAHHDRRPAGTRFQKWTSETTFEVHEDDGMGTTTLIETWNVDADGRLTNGL